MLAHCSAALGQYFQNLVKLLILNLHQVEQICEECWSDDQAIEQNIILKSIQRGATVDLQLCKGGHEVCFMLQGCHS